MNIITNRIRDLTEKKIIVCMTVASVILSAWIMYIQRGWITEDSVLYFEVARLFAVGEWDKGFQLYGWPLYPALIALLHKLVGVGIQQAGQIWNVLFFTLTTFSFLTLIRLAGGNKQVIFCGAALLFSTPYLVGDVLPMLLRDEGFWAFHLASLGFLLNFYRNGEFKYALYWQLCIIIAMLFRIEAFAYLLLAPLILLSNTTLPWRNRLSHYSKTQVFTLASCVVLALLLALSPTLQLRDLGRIQEFITTFPRLYMQLTEGLVMKSQLMGDLILGKYLDDYGMLSIVLALVSIVIVKVISATGWATALILAMPQPEKLRHLNDEARKLIIWVVAIGVVTAFIIILNRFILSSRYLAPITFMLLMLGAFAMSNLLDYIKFKSSSLRAKQVLLILVLIFISINLIKNILPPKADHNFEQIAVAWIKENSAPQRTTFISDAKLRYYAGKPYIGRDDPWKLTINAIRDQSIGGYDYLVLSLNGKNIEQQEYLSEVLTQHRLVKKFSRGPKKVVLIYQKIN